MKTITIDDETVKVSIQPSNARSSIDIEFKPGEIIIRKPIGQTVDIDQILHQKQDLITRKYREAKDKTPIRSEDTILIHGKPRKIHTKQTNETKVTLTNETITIQHKQHENPENILKKWITVQTMQTIKQTLDKHREHLQQPTKITTQDTPRWGYATSNKELVINWQLATLPPELAEYVITHEAVHLQHFNHQKAFHKKLETITPNHKQHRKNLQKYTTHQKTVQAIQ